MKKIFLDMDGVLTDFNNCAMDFFDIKKRDGIITAGSWDSVPNMCQYLGISGREFWDSLTVDFWREMRKMPEADIILDFLSPWEDQLCLLTTPANGASAHGKIDWIKMNLPNFWKRRRPDSKS